MSLLQAAGLGAMAASLALSVAPAREAWAMAEAKECGKVSPLPVAGLVGNSACWCIYGFLTANWVPMVATNAINCALGMYAISVFGAHGSTKQQGAARRYMAAAAAVPGALAMYAAADRGAEAVATIGRVSVLVCCGMFALPLAELAQVLRTGSTATMSFAFTAGSLVCSAAWLWYGWLLGDVNVMAPNAVGLALALAQLGLFGAFGRGGDDGPRRPALP